MSFLRRLLGADDAPRPAVPTRGPNDPPWLGGTAVEATLLGGSLALEVKGESFYQENLWHLVGGRASERVEREVAAVLYAEPANEHDPHAISVWVKGLKVGHLSREDAAAYRPGLLELEQDEGRPIALRGRIIGGGHRDGRDEMLGVWLYHDPEAFGLTGPNPIRSDHAASGAINTGAGATHLAWLDKLPRDPARAIPRLRQLLEAESDAVNRHYMFSELEDALYRCRDAFPTALDDFDAVCEQHHQEMPAIRPAIIDRFGAVPYLTTYRQAAIRRQKQHAFSEALLWAERGIEVYGNQAHNSDHVLELMERAAKYRARVVG